MIKTIATLYTKRWFFTRWVVSVSILVLLFPSITFANQELESLGRLLFFDANLSYNRSQSCATCHDPNNAFSDKRDNNINAAVSLGDDNTSLGDRNAPTLSYISYVPDFSKNQLEEYVGGLFYDGRAPDLERQALIPILDRKEMNMHDGLMLINRISENQDYVQRFEQQFGKDVFEDNTDALSAVGKAIAEFERSPFFSSFDSKYDRYLQGEYQLTKEEDLGRKLFFSQLWNCNVCHLSHTSSHQQYETFSNYKYHNIGTPVNHKVRQHNGTPANYVDAGLLQNPQVDDIRLRGKFRVPTLRNIAVTAPYMHNGVFKELSTVIQFYNKYQIQNNTSRINPETHSPWQEAEIKETVDLELLSQGQPIQGRTMDAMLAFLRSLTDARYEQLLKD